MEVTRTAAGRLKITHHAMIDGIRVRKTKQLPIGIQDEAQAMLIGASLFGPRQSTLEASLENLQASPIDLGSIYFARNAGHPGVVKIGMSRTSVHDRMRNLSTAQPQPWVLIGHARVRHVAQLESILHIEFTDCRVAMNREFFTMTTEAALSALELCRRIDGVDLNAAIMKIK